MATPDNPHWNPCPRPGCKRSRQYGQFSCKPCWLGLPKEIRDRIWDAWRRYQGDMNCLSELRDAQQRAHEYWQRNPLPAA